MHKLHKCGCLTQASPSMWLPIMNSSRTSSVWLDYVQECKIFGIENILIQLSSRSQVQHVPNLMWCLISIDMMPEGRYKMMLSESSWRISKGNMLILHCVKYNHLSLLTVNQSREVIKCSRDAKTKVKRQQRLLTLGYILNLHHIESNFWPLSIWEPTTSTTFNSLQHNMRPPRVSPKWH